MRKFVSIILILLIVINNPLFIYANTNLNNIYKSFLFNENVIFDENKNNDNLSEFNKFKNDSLQNTIKDTIKDTIQTDIKEKELTNNNLVITNSYLAGKMQAEKDIVRFVPESKWGIWGFLGGFFLSTTGCLVVSLMAYLSDDIPAYLGRKFKNKNPEYMMGYNETIKSKIKNKRAMKAFWGGLIGGMTSILIYFLFEMFLIYIFSSSL